MSAGGANKKDAQNPIVVPDLNALKEVIVAPLDEGTVATVVALSDAQYVLHKTGALAESLPFVVVPKLGSPSSGAAGAYWLQEFVCGVQGSDSVELTVDQTLSTTDIATIPNVFFDIPEPTGFGGKMAIQVITAPPPEGGVLLIDFSGVLQLDPGSQIIDSVEVLNVQASAMVGIFVNGGTFTDQLIALGSFNALNPNTITFNIITEAVVPAIETVGITKRFPKDAMPALPQGTYTITAKWALDTLGAQVSCSALTHGITPTEGPPQQFYMCLRVQEVSC